MRTSFHHQPEAQHPIFSYLQAGRPDYPIFWREADMVRPAEQIDPTRMTQS